MPRSNLARIHPSNNATEPDTAESANWPDYLDVVRELCFEHPNISVVIHAKATVKIGKSMQRRTVRRIKTRTRTRGSRP